MLRPTCDATRIVSLELVPFIRNVSKLLARYAVPPFELKPAERVWPELAGRVSGLVIPRFDEVGTAEWVARLVAELSFFRETGQSPRQMEDSEAPAPFLVEAALKYRYSMKRRDRNGRIFNTVDDRPRLQLGKLRRTSKRELRRQFAEAFAGLDPNAPDCRMGLGKLVRTAIRKRTYPEAPLSQQQCGDILGAFFGKLLNKPVPERSVQLKREGRFNYLRDLARESLTFFAEKRASTLDAVGTNCVLYPSEEMLVTVLDQAHFWAENIRQAVFRVIYDRILAETGLSLSVKAQALFLLLTRPVPETDDSCILQSVFWTSFLEIRKCRAALVSALEAADAKHESASDIATAVWSDRQLQRAVLAFSDCWGDVQEVNRRKTQQPVAMTDLDLDSVARRGYRTSERDAEDDDTFDHSPEELRKRATTLETILTTSGIKVGAALKSIRSIPEAQLAVVIARNCCGDGERERRLRGVLIEFKGLSLKHAAAHLGIGHEQLCESVRAALLILARGLLGKQTSRTGRRLRPLGSQAVRASLASRRPPRA